MKKIGLKTRKLVASMILMAAIAVIAGLAGRLLVLGVTTEAMDINWNDWVRNRNYEDSWTLAEHIGTDLNYILEYVGLKQMLEEKDGSLNLRRPALVVENEDGVRTLYSMQDLITQGEEYGIYLYRPVGGCVEIRESSRSFESESVRVLWQLGNREDAMTDLSEDAWAVREARAQQALTAEPEETESFTIPSEDELWRLSAEDLLAMLRAVPVDYAEMGILVLPEELDGMEERIALLRQTDLESEELYGIREEMIYYPNQYRENQVQDEEHQSMYELIRRFMWNCLWNYYHCQYMLEEVDSNLSYQIILEKGEARRIYSDPDTSSGSLLSTENMNAYYSYDSASQQLASSLGDLGWLPHVYLKNNSCVDYDQATIVVGLDTDHMVYEDSYRMEAVSYGRYRSQVFGSVGILVGCVIAMFVTMVWLMFLSGHKEGVEGIYLNGYDRIPTELGACGILAMIVGFGSGCWLIVEVMSAYLSYRQEGLSPLLLIGVLGLEVVLVYLMLWLGFYGLVRRFKAHTLWKNSLTARVLGWCMKPVRWCGGQVKRFWNMLLNAGDTTWKTLAVFCAYFIVNFIWGTNLYYSSSMSMLLYLLFNAAIGVFLVWRAAQMKRVHAGVKKIADGNMDYHLPLENLTGESRRLAIQINRISVSLKNAIEDSVKNERMKTDLITNVSHDIKTPLTSIINYVDLLKRENIEDPKIQGYIDVLDKKSQRLKTLTEDLVEASRASSGTLKLNLERIDFIELINQTSGEFMDRFETKNLAVIPSVPAEPVYIMADGRYVWRILENLYRNAEKYAMPGTRVYIDVFEKFGRIFFVMKNVSQAPLNIKADELTERFIRGDVSRSTEGSGLGLSIAKDMTELMNGTFKIYLDGDLFRVTISFAVIAQKKTDLKEMEQSIRRRMAEEEARGATRLTDGAGENVLNRAGGAQTGERGVLPAFERGEENRFENGFQPDLWDRLHGKLPKLPRLSFGRGKKRGSVVEEDRGQQAPPQAGEEQEYLDDFYDV